MTAKARRVLKAMIAAACCGSLAVLVGYFARPGLDCPVRQYDLGVVTTGSSGSRVIVPVRNEGLFPLRLWYLSSTCGCVRIATVPASIGLGAKADVVLNVDPTVAGGGESTQEVLLGSNDPRHRTLLIRVNWRGRPHQDVLVAPMMVDASISEDAVRESRASASGVIAVVDAWHDRPQHLRIERVTASPGLAVLMNQIRYSCVTCANGAIAHAYRIEYILAPTLPVGPFHGSIDIRTNHPDYRRIHVPITYHILPSVYAVPLSVSYSASDRVSSRTVVLRGERTTASAPHVTTDAPWLAASIKPGAPDQVVIRLVPDILSPGDPLSMLSGVVYVRGIGDSADDVMIPVAVIGARFERSTVR